MDRHVYSRASVVQRVLLQHFTSRTLLLTPVEHMTVVMMIAQVNVKEMNVDSNAMRILEKADFGDIFMAPLQSGLVKTLIMQL